MISLYVKQLTKAFGKNRVWHNLSFRHEKGILGIAGPNGSGKSTLLKCISGLERPGSGSVTWKIENCSVEIEVIKKKMGYAAPYISLYNELTVIENIRFLGELRKAPVNSPFISQLLHRVKLGDMGDEPYGILSSGQQQRARLAAALFTEPNVLLLDEPGTNLDEEGRLLVKNILNQAKEKQTMVILASNRSEELALCDRVFSVQQKEPISP